MPLHGRELEDPSQGVWEHFGTQEWCSCLHVRRAGKFLNSTSRLSSLSSFCSESISWGPRIRILLFSSSLALCSSVIIFYIIINLCVYPCVYMFYMVWPTRFWVLWEWGPCFPHSCLYLLLVHSKCSVNILDMENSKGEQVLWLFNDLSWNKWQVQFVCLVCPGWGPFH